MSDAVSSTRGRDIGGSPNILFPSSSSFRYAPSSYHGELRGGGGDPGSGVGGNGDSHSNLIIWGTDVNAGSCKRQFTGFLRDPKFTVEKADMDEAQFEWERSDKPRPLYLTKLEEISQSLSEPYLTVNCAHVKEYDKVLYRRLVFYPSEMIQIFDMAANELFQDLYPEQHAITIYVRPFNVDQTTTIRSLNPSDNGQLVTISGLVTRCSPIHPEMYHAFFKCRSCSLTIDVPVENGRIHEPNVCATCNSKSCFALIHNHCKYKDIQVVKLQESSDDMPVGQTPSTISLVACVDLVDKVNPGDKIFVTGIFRTAIVRVNPKIRKIKAIFRTVIDCMHFRRLKEGRLHDESAHLRLDPQRMDKLKALALDKDIYKRLANSLCPSIFGHLGVKKGVLLQLFGGTSKEVPGSHLDANLRHFRADLNILLCGDPGTSKSQILQFVHKVVPRGQYTSGKGSSAVGLTAYVKRDLDTKQLGLETGALVMCDGGICCIDEFDKMSDATKSALHEVMENQTLSVAKAGIVCQLNARTSVLAAANPVESKWDKRKTVLDNIKMIDTLLSRFDLIFIILDPNNADYDRTLAEHLISIYRGNNDTELEDRVEPDLLKDYIAYARAHIHPKLSEGATEHLVKKYCELRNSSDSRGRVQVYPRNLESLIRLSEAHAKMRLSNVVERDDVREAVRLTKEALQHHSTDPLTGRLI